VKGLVGSGSQGSCSFDYGFLMETIAQFRRLLQLS